MTMSKHLFTLAVAVCSVVFAVPANAQQRGGAQPRKAPPKAGAWWYRGTPQPAAAHPDLTGVWFGGTSADLSKYTLPGQELILTPYGKQRYDMVDHAKDPNTLEHIVTYNDPVFFAKPFTTRRLFKRQVGDRIMDHSCLENEKDIINLVPTLGDAGR